MDQCPGTRSMFCDDAAVANVAQSVKKVACLLDEKQVKTCSAISNFICTIVSGQKLARKHLHHLLKLVFAPM
jgi:hypothetical protein